jgi:surfactin family lipopeptide synthetase C
VMKTKNIDDIYELTPIQHGILFHSLYAPDSGAYIEQLSFTFKGKPNLDAFWRAWKTIIERHPILRTMFQVQETEKPIQVVFKDFDFPYEELDWSHLPIDEQEQSYKLFLEEDRRRGFDLSQPPLMRFTFIQLDLETFRLAWRFSHLIMDGWSFSLAIQEFINLYKAYCKDSTVDLLPARPYRDYVLWWKHQDVSQSELFWRDYFRGFVPIEPLRLGNVDKLNDTISHHSYDLDLNDIADNLRFLGKQGQLTMNTIFQAAWTLVLSRYTGEEDIIVGSTSVHQPANLVNSLSESMIGPMVVTLPIRAQFQPDEPILSWLQQFQMHLASVREHSNASLVQIQEWSGLPQSRPLFESNVAFENVPIPEGNMLRNEGLEVISAVYDGRPHYPLTLVIFPGNDLRGRVIYERKRFSHESIAQLLRNLKTALVSIAENPHQVIKDINILNCEDQIQLLKGTQVELELVACCLHESFEKQAEETPDAIAVTFEEESSTYRELNAKSNQLAHRLRDCGIGLEDRVGLCVERSLNMIIGILGILKAGAAYVPLDPIYPSERLTFMCKDSEASVLLTEAAMAKKLPQKDHKIICFDLDADNISLESTANVVSNISPENLAYVIYTSGSTGVPKGTLVTHANVARLISSTKKLFDFSAKDIWSLFHSYAFDVSVWEMWGAFFSGSQLVIVPYWISRSPDHFYDFLSRYKITMLSQTPSAFLQLIQVDSSIQLSKSLELKYIFFAGERLDFQSLKPWMDIHGDNNPQLINMYGITETTVHVTYKRITVDDLKLGSKSLIGVPLPDLKIYLVDKYLRLVPNGAKGEICVAGKGVARGYLNRPDLTDQKFVQNPFSNSLDDARMYRSGDLAISQGNNNFEFLGRGDNQVKIRGFRIEIGEIEVILRSYPGIAGAVVSLYEDGAGEKSIIAYLLTQENPFSISDLRSFLRKKLPDYMIPAAFMQVDKIPLTPNGKVDFKSLPSPTELLRDESRRYAEPKTVTEKDLAGIMKDILKISKIGTQDNLLDVGLHSLLATKIATRIRKNLKFNMPLRAIFETPTIEALAQLVENGSEEVLPGELLPENLMAEVSLASELILPVQPVPNWSWRTLPENIFLTGGTGFLGGFLLEQLLQLNSSSRIFCLVRCTNIDEGKKRLRENLIAFGIWDEYIESRIIPVPGDLSKPRLGLNEEEFIKLSEQVDEVYHCGAHVNFLYPYTRLKASNVLGTKEILRLTTTRKIKPLHYISTVGVTGVGQHSSIVEADLPEDPPNGLLNGYVQSKWVAERIVSLAQLRGLPIAIYRPGRIAGHSKTGVSQTKDAVCQALKTFVYMQKSPKINISFDMVPVDYVCSAIAYLARQQASLGRIFHITNPQRVSSNDLIDGLKLSGYDICLVSFDEWNKELNSLSNDQPEQDFAATHSLFINWLERQMGTEKEPHFDCANTISILGNHLTCPTVDEKVLQTYLSYLAQIGYIPGGILTPKVLG